MASTDINPNIANFIRSHHIAVLATSNKDSLPHAAAIYYGTDSLLNILFITKKKTTKSINLEINPIAAMVIYEAETQTVAQINGRVVRVNDPELMEKAQRVMSQYSLQTSGTEETPISKLDSGENILYKLIPHTIRLGEYKYGPKNQIFDTAIAGGESLD